MENQEETMSNKIICPICTKPKEGEVFELTPTPTYYQPKITHSVDCPLYEIGAIEK